MVSEENKREKLLEAPTKPRQNGVKLVIIVLLNITKDIMIKNSKQVYKSI